MKTHLTEKSLASVLKVIYPNHEFIHGHKVPKSKIRNQADYFNEQLNNSCETILNDIKKDTVYFEIGYSVIRIPYFIQLETRTIKHLFQVNIEFPQCFPHGFIDQVAMLPGDYCELGIIKFLKDIERFNYIENEIISSLKEKINTIGIMSKVLPPSLFPLVK